MLNSNRNIFNSRKVFGKDKAQTKKKPVRRKKKKTRRQKSSASLSWAERSFGHKYKRAFWIGGLAVILVYALLFNHFFVAPYRYRWRAIFGEAKLPDNYSIHGIDVSHHQGTIDWDKVATATIADDARVEFVFIKATEGKSHLDRNFQRNFRKAGQYGLIRGAYHYFSPNVPGDQQARYFMDNVQLEEGDLPPVLDIEEIGDQTPETLRKEALEWLNLMERRFGTPPIIYTYLTFKKNYLNTPEFDRYPFWIAHYKVKKLRYKGAWNFLQHTEEGCIDGITGKVDFNVYNGSLDDLQKLAIGNVLSRKAQRRQNPIAASTQKNVPTAAKRKPSHPKPPHAKHAKSRTPKQHPLSNKRTKETKRSKSAKRTKTQKRRK